jgi:transglutaminase-like putative cysteine protease
MLYHWPGKRLLADTIVHRKRHATGHDGRRHACSFDLRRWIAPPDDEQMRDAWREIALAHTVELACLKPRPARDAKAKAIWQFIVEQVRFVTEQNGVDFWQLPEETLALASGDCEDKSFLTASLLLAAGVPEDHVRVVVGATVRPGDVPGSQRVGGHA